MEKSPTPVHRRSIRKVAGIVVLIASVLTLICIILLTYYADPIVNALLKRRNISNFVKAFPDYTLRIVGLHYVPLSNRLSCDSVYLTTSDSGLTCTVGSFSLSHVGWLHLLKGNALTPDYLAESEVEAEDVVVTLPRSQYEIVCGRLHGSVSDSAIVAEAVELRPVADDTHFFSSNNFRRTRYRLNVSLVRMKGAGCLGILSRTEYYARTVELQDPTIDILTNKYKRAEGDTVNPLLPHETLMSIAATIRVDSLTLTNGALRYGERMARGQKPAEIQLDSMNVTIGGIANQCCDHDSTVLTAEGRFMGTSRLVVRMAIPVAPKSFSMRYSGSVTNLDLGALNRFLTVAAPVRIKSGTLQRAKFDVTVTNGYASGTLRAVYDDFAIALRDKKTGSEKGVFNRVASFVANKIKLRTSNVPDESGEMPVGVVAYQREPDDAFIRFLWFALRTGLRDLGRF